MKSVRQGRVRNCNCLLVWLLLRWEGGDDSRVACGSRCIKLHVDERGGSSSGMSGQGRLLLHLLRLERRW